MRILPFILSAFVCMSCFAQNDGTTTQIGTNEHPAGWGNTPVVKYPTTKAIFYGSGIDTGKEWNICTGATDGGVEVHMLQKILPIQNCPGDYVVVRVYTLPDGTVVKRQIRRLSNGPVPV